jgi:hypothetical protein
MSFISNLLGGGGGDGGQSSDASSQALVDQIIGANKQQEKTANDATDTLNQLVVAAAGQSKQLGDAYNARRDAMLGGNRFMTAGYGGSMGSRTLGGDRWLLGG